MKLEEKKSICNSCPKKLDDSCWAWKKIEVGVSCPIGAFENSDAYKKLKKLKAIDTDTKSESIPPKDIQDIFFGLKVGELPMKYVDLRKQYLSDKKNLGSGCSQCKLNGLISKYKKKIANI